MSFEKHRVPLFQSIPEDGEYFSSPSVYRGSTRRGREFFTIESGELKIENENKV